MPFKFFVIDPPKKMTEESVRQAAEDMLAALKGATPDAPEQQLSDASAQDVDGAPPQDAEESSVKLKGDEANSEDDGADGNAFNKDRSEPEDV